MNRKRNKRKHGDSVAEADGSLPNQGPKPATRTLIQRCLTVGVCFHLLAIWISFTSVVEPSSLHGQLAQSLRGYLQITHFGADDRPVYLAYGDPQEQPHRLEVATSAMSGFGSREALDWQPAGPEAVGGMAVSDRLHRWLSTAAVLAENQQSSLVAELLLPIVQADPTLTAIRIVRLPTDLSDFNAEQETVYIAHVARDQDRVSLVQLQPTRLNAQVLPRLDDSRGREQ
ncbi:MAG: hypothetical protein AB8B91_01820 [Rubripirellula sp.]